jgi:hypothetical protein
VVLAMRVKGSIKVMLAFLSSRLPMEIVILKGVMVNVLDIMVTGTKVVLCRCGWCIS